MKLKRGGLVHQLLTAFGIFGERSATTICSTFWGIVLMLLVTVGIGGAFVAVVIAPLLASFAVFLVTGFITIPMAVFTLTAGVIAVGTTAFYLISLMTDRFSKSEVARFAAEAYKAHKEKFCLNVSFKD